MGAKSANSVIDNRSEQISLLLSIWRVLGPKCKMAQFTKSNC
jgi:hypothetical protein